MAPKAATNPIAAIEAELTNLAARRSTLEERHAKTATALDAARTARKTALATDPAADLAKLTATVRNGEDELATIDGVLDDLAEQEVDADRRLATIQDRNERAAAAKTLISVASAVDAAAAELEKALAQVGRAYASLVAAVPRTLAVVTLSGRVEPSLDLSSDGTPVLLRDTRGNAAPNDLARTILAEGIARECPGAMAVRFGANSPRVELLRVDDLHADEPSFDIQDVVNVAMPSTVKEAAAALVSDRLRYRAEAVVAGTVSANLSDVVPMPKPVREPEPIEIIATADFKFRLTEYDDIDRVDQDTVTRLPPDVVARATELGVALRTDTKDGAATVVEVEERRANELARKMSKPLFAITTKPPRMHRDLGVIRPTADAALDAA